MLSKHLLAAGWLAHACEAGEPLCLAKRTGSCRAWGLQASAAPSPSPTCGDAEVGLVGRHVVDAVVFPWQDDVPVLEEGDPAWQPEVRVRPLVDLVGEGAEDAEAEDEALPGVQLLQRLCGAGASRTRARAHLG